MTDDQRPATAATVDSDAFPSGVGSSDPTTSSIVLWTEVARGGHLRWEVTAATSGATAASGGCDVEPGPWSTEVEGLPVGERFDYRFELDGRSSPVGHTRTLPGESLRLGVACCARLPTRDLQAYAGLAADEPDFVVHLGDYVYEDGDHPHVPPHACRTTADYEQRYRQYRHDRHLQLLHAAAPWVTLWDDHEVADDSWRRGSTDDPEGEDWPERRQAALTAHRRWVPMDPGAAGPTPMDRRLRLGGLADVVVLDARHAGRAAPARRTSGPALVAPDDDRAILAPEQWDWLEHAVAECEGWFLLCTQVQVAPLRLAWLPDRRRGLRPTPLVNPGQWDGYPAERWRLAELLAPLRGRVLILSGDLHGRFVTRLDVRGATIPEMTTPSVASVPFARAVRRRAPIPEPVLRRWLRLINPHIDHLELTGHGTTAVDVTAERIELIGLAPDGTTTGRWELRRGETRLTEVG